MEFHGLREHYTPSNCQIIRVNGKDVGFFKKEIRDGSLFLWDIQLEERYRNRGIGSDLVMRLQSEARAAGLPIRLRVLKGNPAIRFYRLNGFRNVVVLDHCIEMEWAAKTPLAARRRGNA